MGLYTPIFGNTQMVGWKILNSTIFMSSTPPSHSPPSVEKHGKNKAQKWARFTPSDSRNGQHQLSPIPLHCCSEDAPDFWELGPSWSVCSEDAPDFWELGPSWSFSSLGEWRYLEEPPDFWELGPEDAFREAAIPFVHFHETPVHGHLHRVFCWCILCLSLFCSILHWIWVTRVFLPSCSMKLKATKAAFLTLPVPLPHSSCAIRHFTEVWLGSITCACILGAAVFAGEAREIVNMFQFLRCIPNYESDDDDSLCVWASQQAI